MMELIRFTAGTFIELDDLLTGQRILAQVCDSGTDYIDHTGRTLPLIGMPILDAMNPVEIGDFRTLKFWMAEKRPALYDDFSAFIKALFEAMPQFDDITFMRAVKWAYDGGNFQAPDGVEQALTAAYAAEWASIERKRYGENISDGAPALH